MFFQVCRIYVWLEKDGIGRGDACRAERILALPLVERQPACLRVAARINKSFGFEDFLKVSVFAESAVKGDEKYVDLLVVEGVEGAGFDIRSNNADVGLFQGVGDTFAALNTYLSFTAASAREDRHF